MKPETKTGQRRRRERGELNEEAKAARRPLPPEELLGALNDSVHAAPSAVRVACVRRITKT